MGAIAIGLIPIVVMFDGSLSLAFKAVLSVYGLFSALLSGKNSSYSHSPTPLARRDKQRISWIFDRDNDPGRRPASSSPRFITQFS